MYLFYFIATCYLFVIFETTEKTKFALLAGLACGISVLFRPDYFLFSFFITSLLFFSHFNRRLLLFVKWNSAIMIVSFLVVLPWGLHNMKSTGHFIITSTSLGGTLVSGLAAYPNPWDLGISDIDRKNEALKAGIDAPFEYEGDQFFRKQFSEYVREEPVYYLKTVAYRTIYFFMAPYSWGIEKPPGLPALPEIFKESNFLINILSYLRVYCFVLLSSIFSIFSFFCLVYFMKKGTNEFLVRLSLVTFIYILVSHIFIHITSVYILPAAFLQLFLVISFVKRKSENAQTHNIIS